VLPQTNVIIISYKFGKNLKT